MKTPILAASSEGVIDEGVRVLRAGGLVAFPTDTVYGLAALAFDTDAAQALYIAKDRPAERAIPVLLADSASIALVAIYIPARATALAARFWPGPLTLVLRKGTDVPQTVSPYKTVAVRVPDHPFAQSILRAAGPLAVTSANLGGRPAALTAAEVAEQLGGRIALIIDGGMAPGGRPSTIVDCTQRDLVILRPGPITLQQLQTALG